MVYKLIKGWWGNYRMTPEEVVPAILDYKKNVMSEHIMLGPVS